MSESSPVREVFFDLDGTLHRQDMFGCFLRFMLKRLPVNWLLVIPLLPVAGLVLLLRGRAARWPMSALLWAITVGHRETTLTALEQQFITVFRTKVTPFTTVQQRMTDYLAAGDARVWLVTGSPQRLVVQVYHDAPFLPGVRLLGSQMRRCCGGWVLPLRCLGHEKVVQMEKQLGAPLRLHSGYSDSKQDNPLLSFCEHRWRVTRAGMLQQLE